MEFHKLTLERDAENIIPIWNTFAESAGWDCIYNMDSLDDLLYGLKPSEILDRIDEVNRRDDYLWWDNGLLTSGDYQEAVDRMVDFDSLADDMNENPDRYVNEENFLDVIKLTNDITKDDWLEYAGSYLAAEIGQALNWELTEKEINALQELKTELGPDDYFVEEIDVLLERSSKVYFRHG